MTSFTVDVLCVGQAPYDLSFTTPHHPGPDEKTVATDFVACGGGPAANAAVQVARLGGSSALAAYLGRDVYGDWHLQELKQAGVNTQLIVRGADPTPLSLVLVKPGGRRTLVNYRGATRPLPAASITFSTCHPRVILFDGLEPELSPPLAQQARQQQIPTVLDAGSVHDGTLALLTLVDYVVASAKFSQQYTGLPDPKAAIQQLARLVPNVVITLGEQGVVWKRPFDEGYLAAFPVTAVDATGAGDAFHGAFAYGLAQNMTWLQLLKFASAAGALACTRHGARPALSTRQALTDFWAQPATNAQNLL